VAILHVEDDSSVRSAVRRALNAYGFTVASVDGVRGAKLVLAERCDVSGVLLDLRLRDGNGVDLYHWLMERHPALSRCVAFLTATSDDVALRAMKAAGCRILEKPVGIEELIDIVAEWDGAADDGPGHVVASASPE